MNFTEKTVSTNPEILKRKLGGELFAEITLEDSALTNGVCKAGTPIKADGTVDNTASSAAVGILLNDVYAVNPNGTIVKAFACVNVANIEKSIGTTLNASVKTALPLIVFE